MRTTLAIPPGTLVALTAFIVLLTISIWMRRWDKSRKMAVERAKLIVDGLCRDARNMGDESVENRLKEFWCLVEAYEISPQEIGVEGFPYVEETAYRALRRKLAFYRLKRRKSRQSAFDAERDSVPNLQKQIDRLKFQIGGFHFRYSSDNRF